MKNNYMIKQQILRNTSVWMSAAVLFFLPLSVFAQSPSTFEVLPLQQDTAWNGSDGSGGFADGDAYFYNKYTVQPTYTTWSGFGYSNEKDATTAGHKNQFSALPGEGFNGSATYAIGNGTPGIRILNNARGAVVRGFYVTNTTYAGLSMKNGDAFAKKFGGATGNDKDWFKLTINGYLNGNPKMTEVNFYLADFRFTDNDKDYILDTWEWVDLTSLGLVDSLSFSLSSSDTGQWGMNTPAYFAIDNFNDVSPLTSVTGEEVTLFSVYPNPSSGHIYVELKSASDNEVRISILDARGQEVYTGSDSFEERIEVSLSGLPAGVYFMQVQSGNKVSHLQFIHQ